MMSICSNLHFKFNVYLSQVQIAHEFSLGTARFCIKLTPAINHLYEFLKLMYVLLVGTKMKLSVGH